MTLILGDGINLCRCCQMQNSFCYRLFLTSLIFFSFPNGSSFRNRENSLLICVLSNSALSSVFCFCESPYLLVFCLCIYARAAFTKSKPYFPISKRIKINDADRYTAQQCLVLCHGNIFSTPFLLRFFTHTHTSMAPTAKWNHHYRHIKTMARTTGKLRIGDLNFFTDFSLWS